jgi:hypothetical protein
MSRAIGGPAAKKGDATGVASFVFGQKNSGDGVVVEDFGGPGV